MHGSLRGGEIVDRPEVLVSQGQIPTVSQSKLYVHLIMKPVSWYSITPHSKSIACIARCDCKYLNHRNEISGCIDNVMRMNYKLTR